MPPTLLCVLKRVGFSHGQVRVVWQLHGNVVVCGRHSLPILLL